MSSRNAIGALSSCAGLYRIRVFLLLRWGFCRGFASVSAIVTDRDTTNSITGVEAQLREAQQRFAVMEAERAAERLSLGVPRIDAYPVPKIPNFFRSDPALWFVQVEASLRNSRISVESTMADVVLAALDAEVVTCVKDIILMSPPPTDIYYRVKARIIGTFAASAESNLRKLLKGQVLTDGKPSLVLSRLRNLNGGQCDDAGIRSIFLEQLPANHRAILAATGTEDLDRLAAIADKIADNAGIGDVQIASASKASSPPSLEDEVVRLASCIAELSKKVEQLSKSSNSSRSRQQFRSKSRAGGAGRERSRSRHKSGLCYAHRKFPNNPTSCREWCTHYASWKEKN